MTDKKLSQLPAGSILGDTDLFYVAHDLGGGSFSQVSQTGLALKTYIGAGTGNVSAAGTLANHALVVGRGGTNEATVAALTDGQLAIGSTGNDPVPATLTAGANVTISNAPGSITIAASSGSGTPGGAFNSIEYNNAGAFGGIGPLTNGQLVIGSTGAVPVAAALTAGANVTITNAAGSITIASTGGTGSPGGSSGQVQYNNSGAFDGAANFTITSGNPNVTTGNAYLYNGVKALQADTAVRNWFVGNAGNLTATGVNNIGFGDGALSGITTGTGNAGMGRGALNGCTTGSGNSADGFFALLSLTSGVGNFAMGTNTMENLVDGSNNVGIGNAALQNTVHGGNNIAIGSAALNTLNNTGDLNVGIGANALINYNGTTGQNTAIGHDAGYQITTGDKNTCIGAFASLGSVAGGTDLTTGNQNIVIGFKNGIPVAGNDGQLVIGNYVYGTGLTGIGDTISTAKIGIGIKAPAVELDVAGSVNIASGKTYQYNGNPLNPRPQRSVTTSPITVAADDQIITCNITSGSPACTLPTAVGGRSGIPITFVDVGGQFTAHPLTITAFAGEFIAGLASVTLSNNYSAVTLTPINDGVNTGWMII